MAKKQTRRSISVSRTTYERLKAFCEANNISMSQLVETRVNDFLGEGTTTITPRPDTYRPPTPSPQPARPAPTTSSITPAPIKPSTEAAPPQRPSQPVIPMTSAAARYAVEPPPPFIKPREPVDAKPPTPPTADQIFTF